jgi:hypothetical protein
MPTRNLKKNQEKSQRALDRNRKNAEQSIAKDYRLALDLIRAELSKVIERHGKIDNEVMSKFNRRKKLFKKINGILNQLFASNNRKTKRLVDGEYKQSYFRNAWTIDQNIGVELKWQLKK